MKYIAYLFISSIVFYSFYKFYFVGNPIHIGDYASYLKDPIFYGGVLLAVIVDILLVSMMTMNEKKF
ncbi:hypothetical protein [Myroides sp. N17-2]|uniref:hypothetical protein n=1 Tax=Myroides sp. N17-2 TaxID=2030799 RepID=UPI000EFCB13E|nr:hypothetical protein [Myroides sp. N17-2]